MTIYTVAEHKFAPGHTIEAVIKLVNHQGLTQQMTAKLLADYYIINGHEVPKAGQTVLIPVLAGFIGLNPKYPVKTIDV